MMKKAKGLTSDNAEDDRNIAESPLGRDEPRDSHEELEARLRFETLIADLSSEFVNLPSCDVDRKIQDAQRCVCECLGLDLSALWEWSTEAPSVLTLTHLYRALEGAPTPERMDGHEYFPWCQQQLLAGRVIAVSSLDELPAEAHRDRQTWLHYGIKTTLTFPLSAGGAPPLGALSFNTVRAERTWPEPIIKRLQLIAQIFTNALARKRSDEMLRESEERLKIAADSAEAGLWSYDIGTGRFWLTEKTRELFGLQVDEDVTFDRFLALVHPDDRDLVYETMQAVMHSRSEGRVEYRVLRPDGSVDWFLSRGRSRGNPAGEPVAVTGLSMDITRRKLMETALEERLRFEKLLADLSARFLNVPCDQIDGWIDGGLKLLVESLGNDRISFGRFTEDTGHLLVTHSYTVADQPPFSAGVVVDDQLPWFVKQLRLGRMLVLKHLPDDLPAEAVKEKQFCLVHGQKSTLAIPLKAGGTVLGAITFAFLRRPCELGQDIIARMQMIGEIFANVLLRQRSDEAIRAALEENRKLRERLEQENVYLRERVTLKYHHGKIVGRSKALKKVLSEAERVAETDAPVLLLGETGTGKELLAETIHELSARKHRPMVVVNCASLPATLIESELFGRAAGAYTGAASAQVGRFDIADGSTLFLDEIGEFPIELQAKLLRVLQDGRFERLGSPETIAVNVRLIAATNRNLEQAVRDGKFRADLYHRVSVFPIRVPPLRDRREDIPALVWACIERLGQRMGKTVKSIPRKSMEQLQSYSWPGNVRELHNVIERAMILSSGPDLLIEIPTLAEPTPRLTLSEGMRDQILRVLQQTGWRIRGVGGAAEILGVKPTTLEARMAKLGIVREKRNSNIS